jgi:ribonucleoside-diphosphate reductase beta chain
MAEQISQEAMHNQSYQYLIETIIPSNKRAEIYDLWRTDKVLKDRCEFIASSYQKYIDSPTQSNYFGSLCSNYILEGLYFYNGFQYFYNLASRHLMAGSADIFRMINRDELSHVRLYQKLIVEALQLFPKESIKKGIASSFLEAVNQEINWSNHIIGNQILGITEESIDHYTKYLANIRLKAIGLNPIFTEDKYKKSPYSHLEKFSDTQGEGHTKSNFFEATVTSYVMSSGLTGWDDI